MKVEASAFLTSPSHAIFLWPYYPDMLTNSSAIVETEVFYGLFTHRQLDLPVLLMWRFRLNVFPQGTVCCFPRSIVRNFGGMIVSVLICKRNLKRMKQNKGVLDATRVQYLLFLLLIHFKIKFSSKLVLN